MASFDRSYGVGRARDPDRRRRLERETHHLETHFHSLIEQRAIARGRWLLHDVELERRQGAGHFPAASFPHETFA